jgi:phenylacetic acid degradation operon negative regulatory protein
VAEWCHAWRGAVPEEPPDVDALWSLPDWVATAADLRHDLRALSPGFEAGDAAELAAGFVTSASVLRHLQADPLLPSELLPADWPGAALRHEYDRFDAAYRSALRAWFAAAR